MVEKKPLVKVKGIGVSFGATRALDDVDFEFYPGEILALVGANGAGKSTLIKVICGYYQNYEGEIIVGDEPQTFTCPKDAYDVGIQTVHQIINQGVVPNMTVAENLALKQLLSPEQPLFYSHEKLKEQARPIAQRMNLDYLDLDAQLSEIGQSDRQMISIARALSSNPNLLILDEPTSSLSEKEADRLFQTLFRLRDEGVSIVYVSHRLHEITRLADRVGVLRDGKVAGILKAPFSVKEMVTAMVGEVNRNPVTGVSDRVNKKVVKLELRDVVIQEGHKPINLKLYEGEIVGLTGLIGAGKSELAQLLYGDEELISGEIFLDGKPYNPKNIKDAIRQGVYMVPEDRNNNAVIPDFSIRHNLNIPFLDFFSSRLGIMKNLKEKKESLRIVKSMGIKCASESAPIESLSGGNQQKVMVGRWFLKDYNLFILDEPFQGVDVRSRIEIGAYLRENIGTNCALLIATDLDEVIEVADRIVVMNHGVLVGEQLAGNIERDKLLHWTAQTVEEVAAQE
ncbi:MAG: sugar ABC transporter ATP-binding protein [Spirochaetales bacterium]|nr:sugar ABC transporter ATP-binding protein [Spirochaetales bacterium]